MNLFCSTLICYFKEQIPSMNPEGFHKNVSQYSVLCRFPSKKSSGVQKIMFSHISGKSNNVFFGINVRTW